MFDCFLLFVAPMSMLALICIFAMYRFWIFSCFEMPLLYRDQTAFVSHNLTCCDLQKFFIVRSAFPSALFISRMLGIYLDATHIEMIIHI